MHQMNRTYIMDMWWWKSKKIILSFFSFPCALLVDQHCIYSAWLAKKEQNAKNQRTSMSLSSSFKCIHGAVYASSVLILFWCLCSYSQWKMNNWGDSKLDYWTEFGRSWLIVLSVGWTSFRLWQEAVRLSLVKFQ